MGFFGDLLDDFTGATAKKAAKQQAAGYDQASQTLQTQADTTNALLEPFAQGGAAAHNRLLSLLGLEGGDGGTFEGSPGFDFAFQTGMKGVNNALGAGGLRGSGRAIKEATRYGQGLAMQDRGNEINRLMGLSGAGQNAATNQAQFGENRSNALAGFNIGRGDVLGSGMINAGNARVGTVNNLIDMVGSGIGFADAKGWFG